MAECRVPLACRAATPPRALSRAPGAKSALSTHSRMLPHRRRISVLRNTLEGANGSAFEGSGAEGGALEGSVPEEEAAHAQAFTHTDCARDCASGLACLPVWEVLQLAQLAFENE